MKDKYSTQHTKDIIMESKVDISQPMARLLYATCDIIGAVAVASGETGNSLIDDMNEAINKLNSTTDMQVKAKQLRTLVTSAMALIYLSRQIDKSEAN